MIPVGILSGKKGTYKNVALASNGSTIADLARPIDYGTSINNIIQGYRLVDSSNTTNYAGWVTSTVTFEIDLKAVKKIEEVNFIHGSADGTNFGENTPNLNVFLAGGFGTSTIITYSTDGVTYNTLSSSDYTLVYLFSKNILPTPINARYFKVYNNMGGEIFVSGVELWGTN